MYSPSDVERDSSYGNQYGARRQPDSVVSLPASFELAAGVSLLNFRHPANVVASFNHVQSFAVGVTCLVIGLLCIIFNIVNICFIDQIGWVVYITGNGFWTGCMCLTSGGFCVAASRNKSRLLIACCVLADMSTAFLALQQLVVGVRGAVWATHLCTYQRLRNPDAVCSVGHVTTAIEASLAAIAILAIIASTWSLVISCRALNCCAQVSVSQFGSSSNRGGVSSVSETAGTTTAVVYRQGTDDVVAATSSQTDRNSHYAALY